MNTINYTKMGKTKLYLLIIMLFAGLTGQAQAPDWSVNPGDYSYNMTYTGVINIDYQESTDTNDIIAAFVGDQCRGVAQPVYNESVGRYICYLMVYSNTPSETISFKVYDASADQIRDIPQTSEFEVNGIVGQIDKPYIWSDPRLSSESELLTFQLENQTKPTRFDSLSIYVEIPWGSEFTNLIATFTTSYRAVVRLGGPDGEIQQSGVTANDFSQPVVYWVRSADETDTSLYTVYVSWENSVPTDITLSDTTIDATYKKGSFIGYFKTTDRDTADIHEYTLVEGEGDYDNDMFLIDGNKLYLNTDIYFETADNFSIRVKTDDGKGGTFEKAFTIVVDLLSEDSKVRANNIISPNGDGIFDTWVIQNAGLYSDCEIIILNSAGEVVYRSIGYEKEWDGRYNGKELPIGAYYYIIKTPQNIVYKGVISLIK